jgi:hypothetical protein
LGYLMGWFSDVVDSVSNVVSQAVDTVSAAGQSTINAATNHPLETAAVVGGGYYLYPEAGALSSSLAPVSDAVSVSTADMGAGAVSGIDLGGAGASPASWLNATTANMTGSAASGWTTGQILSTASAGLNLAGQSVKLATLGKTMNATTATSDGLTGALAASPLQTPSGLITTTPQGPVMTGTQTSTGGFMGMDMQTLMVIGFSAGVIWYLTKHAKA